MTKQIASLVERVGALKGADSLLDIEIENLMPCSNKWSVTHPPEGRTLYLERAAKFHFSRLGDDEGEEYKAAPYTGSIDDAVAFKEAMLPGWRRHVIESRDGFFVAVRGRQTHGMGEAKHLSEPLALVLAVLRALEAQHGEG